MILGRGSFKKQRFYTCLALILLALSFFLLPSRARALSSADGLPSTIIPNNGINHYTSPDSTYVPWLVVTLPGGNGMNGPRSVVSVYWPTSSKTVDITIQDACDNSIQDGGIMYNTTYYYIANAASVVRTAGFSTNPVYLGNTTIGTNTYGNIECNGQSKGSYNLSLKITADDLTTEKIYYKNGLFYKVNIMAKTGANTGYYVNRYKIKIDLPTTGYVGYTKQNGGSATDAAENFTGLAYADSFTGSFSWSTKIAFALSCRAPKDTSNVVRFFDTDHINNTLAITSPNWQNNSAGKTMSYIIREYTRSGTFIKNAASGTLTAPNGAYESTASFSMDPANVYSIYIYNINKINSIQVSLPYDQIYASDTCDSQLSCNMSAPALIAAGSNVEVKAKIKNTSGVNWVYNPAIDFNSGNYTLGVVDSSQAYAKLNGSLADTVIGAGNNTGPPDFNNASFVSDLDGISTKRYFLASSLITGGNGIDRFGMQQTIYAGGDEVEFSFYVVAPPLGQTRSIGVRILDRARQIDGSSYWLDWNPGCSLNITSSAVTSSCKVQDELEIEIGKAYTPKYTVSNNSGSPITVTPTFTMTGFVFSAVENNLVVASTNSPVPGNSTNSITFIAGQEKLWTINLSVKWTVGANVYTIICTPGTVNVIKKPFFQVTNGDLLVGATSNCSDSLTSGGNLFSWATGDASFSAASRKGASAQYVAQVLGDVKDFYSASGVTNTTTNTKKYLTLANDSDGGEWGGNFGIGACLKDVYTNTKRDDAKIMPFNSTLPYTVFNPADPANPSQVEFGSEANPAKIAIKGITNFTGNIAVYVTGDVFIGNDGAGNPANFTLSPGSFFALIVKGNIYIDFRATTIEGMLIAQDNSNGGGIIYTCGLYYGDFYNMPINSMYTNCNNKLTVNGIVQAKEIKLHRTFGSLNGVAPNNAPAEVFNGRPELYFVPNPFSNSNNPGTSADTRYDSITNLPPLL